MEQQNSADSDQTVLKGAGTICSDCLQILIRLLPKEQSDLGLHHLLRPICPIIETFTLFRIVYRPVMYFQCETKKL